MMNKNYKYIYSKERHIHMRIYAYARICTLGRWLKVRDERCQQVCCSYRLFTSAASCCCWCCWRYPFRRAKYFVDNRF